MTASRSDALRNRQLVLDAAQACFAAAGPQVPLAEIARLAGVGAGTVHRHFPTKRALVEAVVAARIDDLVAEADRLSARHEPGTAFFAFFAAAVEHIGFNKALCAAFEADSGDPLHVAPTAQRAFHAALGELLDRAQRAGAVRADLDVADVAALVAGCVTMERHHDPERPTGRMTALVSEVLQPGRTPLPAAVTKQATTRQERNETSVGPPQRHETPIGGESPRCEVCGTRIQPARTGRRARFCGAACRQKAHRRRRNHT
ncbi:TetR/AcrR family transcriptional regulator [Goodfellowiella coeruleoviolacea]|uniref:Transcriptional regulator, TetR family n=1 Tax=Goodfellowiella coeruleoviolacea TaxID=334858 RepID=A0AAE3GJB6_9PSEU|nr:TetR/AcrR family transcriptional regulator [Goodfellowiella coeruleoviolacea]MCP2167173.1 transcriptional regulator, TetR family [Goodfellowiella coeruleoviolacea]